MKVLYAAVLLTCVVTMFHYSHGCECPKGTTTMVIEKNSDKEDKTKLIVQTTCKDAKGAILDKCSTTSENPFGPEVQVHSFQYKSVFTNTHTISNGRETENGLETFD